MPFSSDQLEAVAEKLGWTFDRQESSHRMMVKEGQARPLVIPTRRELAPFVLASNLKTLGITKKQFKRILDEL